MNSLLAATVVTTIFQGNLKGKPNFRLLYNESGKVRLYDSFIDQDSLPALCKEWKLVGIREGKATDFHNTSGRTLNISCNGKYSYMTQWDTVTGTWEVFNNEVHLKHYGSFRIEILSSRTLILSFPGNHGRVFNKYEAEMFKWPDDIISQEK